MAWWPSCCPWKIFLLRLDAWRARQSFNLGGVITAVTELRLPTSLGWPPLRGYRPYAKPFGRESNLLRHPCAPLAPIEGFWCCIAMGICRVVWAQVSFVSSDLIAGVLTQQMAF